MDIIETVLVEQISGEIEKFVLVQLTDTDFQSMPKSVYDKMIANQAKGTIS